MSLPPPNPLSSSELSRSRIDSSPPPPPMIARPPPPPGAWTPPPASDDEEEEESDGAEFNVGAEVDKMMVSEAASDMVGLSKKEGNDVCADCTGPVTVVSVAFGVFLCGRCGNMHKKLADLNDDCHLTTTQFDPGDVAFVASRGNISVNEELEACVPTFFARPPAHPAKCESKIWKYWIHLKYGKMRFHKRNVAEDEE
eukprot:331195_1